MFRTFPALSGPLSGLLEFSDISMGKRDMGPQWPSQRLFGSTDIFSEGISHA